MTGLYPELPAAPTIAKIRRGLLRWFARNARELPWRRDRDPYRIWVSEAMLQQTQIAAVIPYFERFLKRFPSVKTLASADLEEVLRFWEGLGYYRRARHLHSAARIVMTEHGGKVPRDVDAFAALPGVGRYTLGAVLSQAFDHRLPLVDGNVERVLARLFLCDVSPSTNGVKGWHWSVTQRLLPRRGVGAFNQALMELGQTVCFPKQPACSKCPLAACCAAHATKRTAEVPRPKASARVTVVNEIAVAIRKGNRFLIVRRPADAERWADFWELPHGERRDGEEDLRGIRRIARELTGLSLADPKRLARITHTVTRFRIHLDCWLASATSAGWRSNFHIAHAWVRAADLGDYPMSKPQRKLANLLGDQVASAGE